MAPGSVGTGCLPCVHRCQRVRRLPRVHTHVQVLVWAHACAQVWAQAGTRLPACVGARAPGWHGRTGVSLRTLRLLCERARQGARALRAQERGRARSAGVCARVCGCPLCTWGCTCWHKRLARACVVLPRMCAHKHVQATGDVHEARTAAWARARRSWGGTGGQAAPVGTVPGHRAPGPRLGTLGLAGAGGGAARGWVPAPTARHGGYSQH